MPHHSDLHFTGDESWYHLPHDGGVAYAPQEGWVLSGTVRANILFGQALDEARYRAVLRECALERDVQAWNAGDATEVGERGVTLRCVAVAEARAALTRAAVVGRGRASRSRARCIRVRRSYCSTMCSQRWMYTLRGGSWTAALAASCCAGAPSSSSYAYALTV